MTKPATVWVENTAKDTPQIAYSSSTVTYNSATTKYSGIDVTLAEDGKDTTLWGGVTKNNTGWQANPASDTNLYDYDSATHDYDSAVDTYDGVTSGQDESGTRIPTSWA